MGLQITVNESNAYVMGADDRSEFSEKESKIPELTQTGMIQISDGGFVTGVLTGENCDVVLSAGHAAIYWKSDNVNNRRKGQLRGEGGFRFYPEPEIQENFINMVLVKSGYQNYGNLGRDKHDWSVFRLSKPAAKNCKNIKFIKNGVHCNGRVLMPAIHFDRRDTRLIDRSCSVKDSLGSDIIVHNCDTKVGSSGAPLYCSDKNGISLLGINISGLARKDLVDPGEFGQDSQNFNYKNHKNFAVTIHGDFLNTLEAELEASAKRKLKRLRK